MGIYYPCCSVCVGGDLLCKIQIPEQVIESLKAGILENSCLNNLLDGIIQLL